jgi:hypothetical protein
LFTEVLANAVFSKIPAQISGSLAVAEKCRIMSVSADDNGGAYIMSNLVHNEHVKLRAAFYNNLAVAVIFGGIFAPIMTGPPVSPEVSIFITIMSLGIAWFLHYCAGNKLRQLRE